MQAPLRQQLVHQRAKPLIVSPLSEMDQLVYHNVLQAGHRFLRQLKIQPDAAGVPVARPPAGLHLPDPQILDRHTSFPLPFGEERRQLVAELAAVPLIEHCLPGVSIITWPSAQLHCRIVEQMNSRAAIVFKHFEPVAPTLKVIAFAGHQLPLRLAFLLLKFSLLPTNPSQT